MNKAPMGILLAAGKSQRFHGNKLLHPLIDAANGETPMLILSAQKLASALPRSIVVINADLVSYSAQLEQLSLQVVINEQAEQGMGSSIACGVSASEDSSGWLIALADMPCIRLETLRQLAQKLQQPDSIVAPLYRQQRGHPVGFGQAYAEELMALQQDIGARTILKKYQHRLELVPTDDPGVVKDIDRLSDL